MKGPEKMLKLATAIMVFVLSATRESGSTHTTTAVYFILPYLTLSCNFVNLHNVRKQSTYVTPVYQLKLQSVLQEANNLCFWLVPKKEVVICSLALHRATGRHTRDAGIPTLSVATPVV